jgi:hypothetical protein
VFGRAPHGLIQPLRTYEARLFDREGRTVASFQLCCRSEGEARAMLDANDRIDYVRYELWRGMTKIGDCARIGDLARSDIATE